MKKVIIGTRGSKLALWQAEFIKSEIGKLNKEIDVELKLVKTKGDKILDQALSKIGDKGLFTKELENELLAGNIDLAVHSLKDLQTEIAPGLKIAAVTKRHNVEDVLIARDNGAGISDIPRGATIATGSLRRRAQLLHIRPDIHTVDLRGNVPTRINKFKESDWYGIILARAGVERLNLEKHISSIIPLQQFLPAVGQGALGIEISDNNENANMIAGLLNSSDTWDCISAERAFLTELGGGCQTPIAAYAYLNNDMIVLDGLVASLDGRIYMKDRISGSRNNSVDIGKKLAQTLLKAGAEDIMAEIRG